MHVGIVRLGEKLLYRRGVAHPIYAMWEEKEHAGEVVGGETDYRRTRAERLVA